MFLDDIVRKKDFVNLFYCSVVRLRCLWSGLKEERKSEDQRVKVFPTLAEGR